MTTFDPAKDPIEVYSREAGQMAELVGHSLVESVLSEGTGIKLVSSPTTGKIEVKIDADAISNGAVTLNGMVNVATDGTTITGDGTTEDPLVAHVQAVADGTTITGNGSIGSPFIARGAAAVYSYDIANGVSVFQSVDLSAYTEIEFDVNNLGVSWGVWPNGKGIPALATGLATPAAPTGVPNGYIANVVLDMGGIGFNHVATRTYQFVKGAAAGVLRKLVYQAYGSAQDTVWIGEKHVPDLFAPRGRPQSILGGITDSYSPGGYTSSDVGSGYYGESGVYRPYDEFLSINNAAGVENTLTGASRTRTLQAMTGNTFRLRSVYHAATGQNLPTTVFGTMTGGAVKLRCYI